MVYPRTGGGNRSSRLGGGLGLGLSPHGRGKLSCLACQRRRRMSIPARAGETPAGVAGQCGAGVYPRTGGGNRYLSSKYHIETGLSPHGRGKPDVRWRCVAILGSIPARAGETVQSLQSDSAGGVYPRTGGGNPCASHPAGRRRGLSPHGRGKRLHLCLGIPDRGSIPARAGETQGSSPHPRPARVYPRTGGGNKLTVDADGPVWGLSPHGRGKRSVMPENSGVEGSIPARAGETIGATVAVVIIGVYPRTGGGN